MFVTDFLAETANGKNALQEVDASGQFPGLTGGPADQIGQQRQDGDANEGIDDRVGHIPGRLAAEREAETNQRLNAAIESMKLQVPIAAEFPLAQAAQAHERLAAGHVAGKIVLTIR